MATENNVIVYVLINASMPGLVKIGMTTRGAKERAEELSRTTGVPTPFLVAYEIEVSDCVAMESEIHRELEEQGLRTNLNREFFSIELKDVIELVISMADKYQYVEGDPSLMREELLRAWWDHNYITAKDCHWAEGIKGPEVARDSVSSLGRYRDLCDELASRGCLSAKGESLYWEAESYGGQIDHNPLRYQKMLDEVAEMGPPQAIESIASNTACFGDEKDNLEFFTAAIDRHQHYHLLADLGTLYRREDNFKGVLDCITGLERASREFKHPLFRALLQNQIVDLIRYKSRYSLDKDSIREIGTYLVRDNELLMKVIEEEVSKAALKRIYHDKMNDISEVVNDHNKMTKCLASGEREEDFEDYDEEDLRDDIEYNRECLADHLKTIRDRELFEDVSSFRNNLSQFADILKAPDRERLKEAFKPCLDDCNVIKVIYKDADNKLCKYMEFVKAEIEALDDECCEE